MIDDIFHLENIEYGVFILSKIKSRYVGSYIGPFWITITQIILVISIGYIYGGMFNIPLKNILLTYGFVYSI